MELDKNGKPITEPNNPSGEPSNSAVDLSTEVEIQINWETKKVTLQELQNGYMRQADYTKKTTTLSEDKKKLLDPRLEEARKVMEEMWFAKVEDITDLIKFKDQFMSEKQSQESDKEFTTFVSQFKTLSDSQKTIIRDLKKFQSDKSYDEILESSWFLDQSLIDKSKTSRRIWGESLWISKEEEKASVSASVKKRMWIKSSSEVSDIINTFNL